MLGYFFFRGYLSFFVWLLFLILDVIYSWVVLFVVILLVLLFFKILLRYGVNFDFRDEDGKILMDKVRERNDEGYREVVYIL